MPILLVRREDEREKGSPFIVQLKGYEDATEIAPCADEAIGALVRKHASKFHYTVQGIRVAGTPEDYVAYLEDCTECVCGFGYSYDSAVGAVVRLHPNLFKTPLVLRPEHNYGTKSP